MLLEHVYIAEKWPNVGKIIQASGHTGIEREMAGGREREKI